MKVYLRDVNLFDLDSQTLVILSRFVVLARKYEAQTLRLNDKNVLEKVFAIGAATKKSQLKILFLSLRECLRGRVIDSEFSKYSLPARRNPVDEPFEISRAS